MTQPAIDPRTQFERGVVVISLDIEQIWGYYDLMTEAQFEARYPEAIQAHSKILASFTNAGIPATWFLVGGMALRESGGPDDFRMVGLPWEWRERIPAGSEETKPLWYRRSFIDELRLACPRQEIGLHAGLTHFIWTDPRATSRNVEWELSGGMQALRQAQVVPISFSFGREQEAHHQLLPAHGIRCFRGRTVSRAFQLGRTPLGSLARVFDEMSRSTPPPVWPEEVLPGLWNIPSSLFLYPIGASRTRVAGLRSRVDRFSKGIEAAARCRGIFHFCLHPENLAESPQGFPMLADLVERLVRARGLGDVEVLTMRDVAARMATVRSRRLSQASEA